MVNSVVRAAVVQAARVVFDTPRSFTDLIDLIRQAGARRAEIAVFPEAIVAGYPEGLVGTFLKDPMETGQELRALAETAESARPCSD